MKSSLCNHISHLRTFQSVSDEPAIHAGFPSHKRPNQPACRSPKKEFPLATRHYLQSPKRLAFGERCALFASRDWRRHSQDAHPDIGASSRSSVAANAPATGPDSENSRSPYCASFAAIGAYVPVGTQASGNTPGGEIAVWAQRPGRMNCTNAFPWLHPLLKACTRTKR